MKCDDSSILHQLMMVVVEFKRLKKDEYFAVPFLIEAKPSIYQFKKKEVKHKIEPMHTAF